MTLHDVYVSSVNGRPLRRCDRAQLTLSLTSFFRTCRKPSQFAVMRHLVASSRSLTTMMSQIGAGSGPFSGVAPDRPDDTLSMLLEAHVDVNEGTLSVHAGDDVGKDGRFSGVDLREHSASIHHLRVGVENDRGLLVRLPARLQSLTLDIRSTDRCDALSVMRDPGAEVLEAWMDKVENDCEGLRRFGIRVAPGCWLPRAHPVLDRSLDDPLEGREYRTEAVEECIVRTMCALRNGPLETLHLEAVEWRFESVPQSVFQFAQSANLRSLWISSGRISEDTFAHFVDVVALLPALVTASLRDASVEDAIRRYGTGWAWPSVSDFCCEWAKKLHGLDGHGIRDLSILGCTDDIVDARRLDDVQSWMDTRQTTVQELMAVADSIPSSMRRLDVFGVVGFLWADRRWSTASSSLRYAQEIIMNRVTEVDSTVSEASAAGMMAMCG